MELDPTFLLISINWGEGTEIFKFNININNLYLYKLNKNMDYQTLSAYITSDRLQ